jgi:hypothetical protein
MSGRLGVWLMRSLAWLPLPWLRGLGAFLGRVLFVLAAPRRKVTLRNLALCFPELSEAERTDLARRNFIVFCQTWLDRSWLWSAPREVVAERVQLQGAVHELDGEAPTILFAPHFYSMDAGGLALPLPEAGDPAALVQIDRARSLKISPLAFHRSGGAGFRRRQAAPLFASAATPLAAAPAAPGPPGRTRAAPWRRRRRHPLNPAHFPAALARSVRRSSGRCRRQPRNPIARRHRARFRRMTCNRLNPRPTG